MTYLRFLYNQECIEYKGRFFTVYILISNCLVDIILILLQNFLTPYNYNISI